MSNQVESTCRVGPVRRHSRASDLRLTLSRDWLIQSVTVDNQKVIVSTLISGSADPGAGEVALWLRAQLHMEWTQIRVPEPIQ